MTRSDFKDLVQQLSHKLYGLAFRILQNQEEAEDAVQEVFFKLWKMGEKIDEYSSKDALAITMTKNYCIDQIRKQKHFQTDSHDDMYQLNISPPTPFEQMEIKESDHIIKSIIDRLPETFRSLIIMKEIEDFSYEEIAEKMDQNINTLRVTLSRARKFIRDEYKKYQNERRGIKRPDREVL
jgi:RNA polymerase sigma-70 factor (ECF subfamily)